MELTHHEIEELLGVYALDAVSPDEADAVELHLRECPRCRAEVAEHREVAAVLAYGGSAAPADIWPRLADSLGDETPPPQLDMARVVSMDAPRRRRPRRSLPLRAAAAVAAVAAAVIAVLGLQVVRLDDRTDQLESALQLTGLEQAAQAAVFAAGSRTVQLRSGDGATFVNAVVRENGDGFLVDDNLPRLSGGLTYQVWAVTGKQAVSVGVLGSDPGTSAFRIVPSGGAVLAVTAERAPGAASPTMTPLVSAPLPLV